jgi:hypothetical protein
MLILFLSFDFDYESDYDNLQNIYKAIGDTPVTFFISAKRHPDKTYEFPENVEIGNHGYSHEEWYGTELDYRVSDLVLNHDWIKEKYGVECKVYRSPHLRNFDDTADEMVKRGYKREMHCSECSVCQPMQHAHLKQYFSSHHHFRSCCNLSFVENFEAICKKGADFTFFLDSHDFTDDRLKYLESIIKIGKKYGEWDLLSNQGSL